MIEQHDQEKSQNNSPADNRKRNNEDIDYRETDTDSESAGTNSESNDETSNIFDEADMDMKQTIVDNTENADTTKITEHDINSNHEHIDEVYRRTRPNVPRRKISRLTSAI